MSNPQQPSRGTPPLPQLEVTPPVVPSVDLEWNDWLCYFVERGYGLRPYFASWGTEEDLLRLGVEGWKTHISVNSIEEELILLTQLAPLLREAKLPHKFVLPTLLRSFNESDTQQGKILTIYDPQLLWASLVPLGSDLDRFLRQPADLPVPTDLSLGGRAYVRYTGYMDDRVINPATGLKEEVPREVGHYKPSWVEDLAPLY